MCFKPAPRAPQGIVHTPFFLTNSYIFIKMLNTCHIYLSQDFNIQKCSIQIFMLLEPILKPYLLQIPSVIYRIKKCSLKSLILWQYLPPKYITQSYR